MNWSKPPTSAAPLELNRVQLEQQTLLPKVSVTLVTSELQGWGRVGASDRRCANWL